MPDFVVHTFPGSPYGRAVLACIEEKGGRWRLAPIAPGAQRAAPHRLRHPFGKVPVLEHGSFQLYETQAILRYLDRVLPSPALTPSAPQAAARMDQVMGVNDAYLFTGCASVIVFHRVVGPRLLGLQPDEAAIAAAMPHARIVFAELANLLAEHSFFGGDALSLADLMVASQLALFIGAPEWPDLISDASNLGGWLDRMLARRSMQATSWERVAQQATATRSTESHTP